MQYGRLFPKSFFSQKEDRSKMKIHRLIFSGLFLAAAVVTLGMVQTQKKADKVPPVIVSRSSIGDVSFPHKFHSEDLEIECQTCHHETNATKLNMPHKDYFKDFWIDCSICHKGDGSTVSEPMSCSKCHHSSPVDIADETLSAKVVIHKKCWECHEIGKGQQASRGCKNCHIKK